MIGKSLTSLIHPSILISSVEIPELGFGLFAAFAGKT